MTSRLHLDIHLKQKSFTLNCCLDLPGDKVTALFGASGSGKTTLLRCIAGLEKAPNNIVTVGTNTWQNKHCFVPTHQRKIGYVFQESNLFPHLTVQDNLLFGFKRIPNAERQIAFADAVNMLGLTDLLQHKPQQLSGGQKQRVAVARALLTSPELLLMDEPLASLDLTSRMDILPYLDKLRSDLKLPIIYVTHSPQEVVHIADHMVYLENGKVTAEGSVNELMTRTDLPLIRFDEACAVIDGDVIKQDKEFHLTYVATNGGTFAVSHQDIAPGASARLRILARDVSLALSPPENTSINNIVPVTVTEMIPLNNPAQVLIKLDMAGIPILSRITRRSVHTLNISTGSKVFAQVKSVALMR